jgi:RimJ/RimL family protein N-acetyltransferase
MIRADGPRPTWGPRHIVRAFDGLVVGSIGFFGPPEHAADGVPEVEVGYGLVESARGHGAATEALTALLAETDRIPVRVRASVRPDNRPSIRVLAKCGFTELRGSNDEGELVMARPVPR